MGLNEAQRVHLAWMAGYFEAKGYTNINKNGSSYAIVVSLNFHHKSEFDDCFYSWLRNNMDSFLGSTVIRDTHIRWYLTGKKARFFLEIILPYMKIPERIKEANMLIRFQDLLTKRGKPKYEGLSNTEIEKRDALYQAFKVVKKANTRPQPEDLDRASEIMSNLAQKGWKGR